MGVERQWTGREWEFRDTELQKLFNTVPSNFHTNTYKKKKKKKNQNSKICYKFPPSIGFHVSVSY
jgi:hypothetical protein